MSICLNRVLRILRAGPHGGSMCAMPKAKKATKTKISPKAKKVPAKKVAAKKPAKKAGAKKAKPAAKSAMRSDRTMSMRGCCCGGAC